MQNIWADDSHEMPSLIFYEKKIKERNELNLTSATVLISTFRVKPLDQSIAKTNDGILYESAHKKRLLITQTTIKGSGMPAHKRSLARTFAVCRHIVGTLRKPQAKMHICSPSRDCTFDHNVSLFIASSYMFIFYKMSCII